MLVRKFIGQRLAEYYAQPANAVVGGTTAASVPLRRLLGEWHWRRVYKRLYKEQEGHWLTPVELFKPYYSNTLANFVAASVIEREQQEALLHDAVQAGQSKSSKTSVIDVVELGGGRGTNAKLILDHLRDAHAEVYQRVQYTIMDSSPSLQELQQEVLSSSGHDGKVTFERKDMLDVAEDAASFLPPSKRSTVVLALELLDNLPHDKIKVRAGRHLEQAEVRRRKDGKKGSDRSEEVFSKLSDPLLQRIVELAPTYTREPLSWVPTVAGGVFERIVKDRPNAQLLLADFDWLPPPDRLQADAPPRCSHWAAGEPLVTSMDSTDYECYLQAPPNCDILFPTNFQKLSSLARKLYKPVGGVVTVQKQADFLQTYGPEQVSQTASWLTGFSPMLHDFANCSVLTVSHPPAADRKR